MTIELTLIVCQLKGVVCFVQGFLLLAEKTIGFCQKGVEKQVVDRLGLTQPRLASFDDFLMFSLEPQDMKQARIDLLLLRQEAGKVVRFLQTASIKAFRGRQLLRSSRQYGQKLTGQQIRALTCSNSRNA